MNAVKLAAEVWNAVKALAQRAGLWRLDAWMWNRQARHLEEIAALAETAGVDVVTVTLARQRAQMLRLAARRARGASS